MALWNKSDNLASTPKYIARKAYFDASSTSVVSASGNTINLIPSNTGFNTGDNVVYSINGGSAIGGLVDGTTYTVRVVGAGLIELYDTWDHAVDTGNTTGRVDITAVGSGTQTLQRNRDANAYGDHNYNGSRIIFVDLDEAEQAENRARGLKNVGWWAYRSWTNADGSVQHRAECLVALSAHRDTTSTTTLNVQTNTSDSATDDDIAVDATTTITVQPVNRSVTHPAGTTFAVTSTAAGAYSSLTYQWQISSDGGSSWSNLSNAGVYSGVSTATLTISNSTGLNGKKYRVICGTDTANTNATSDVVTLTVA